MRCKAYQATSACMYMLQKVTCTVLSRPYVCCLVLTCTAVSFLSPVVVQIMRTAWYYDSVQFLGLL